MGKEDQQARPRHRRRPRHLRHARQEHAVNGGGSARGSGAHIKDEDRHVSQVECELALYTRADSSTREIHQVAGEPIVEFGAPRDAFPDGEGAIKLHEVDEDAAVEFCGLVTVDEGAVKARKPTLPMGGGSCVLGPANGESHLFCRRISACRQWPQHATRGVETFTNHNFGVRSVDREDQVTES